ncbi:MAG TPA: ankyrin repeat domain-containing protein [Solirubrobacteraceae bacterium]
MSAYDRLIEAIFGGDLDGVRAVLAGGLPTLPRPAATTPLYLAAVQDETEIAQLLLDAGADPNEISRVDETEGTPLCAAASHGHSETVRVLLEAGADPDLRDPVVAGDEIGRCPRDWAQLSGDDETIRLLGRASG